MSEAPCELRVLLADDHRLVRAGLRALLEQIPGVCVVAETGDGEETLAQIRALDPDVVVMDIAMPRLGGLQATERACRERPDLKVIILSVHRAEEYVLEALRAGACGYLLKDAATAELALALDAARRGETYLSPGVSAHVVRSAVGPADRTPSSPRPGSGPSQADQRALASDAGGTAAPRGAAGPLRTGRLTPRQTEILRLVAQGRSTKEIAYDLGLSPKTVETHRTQIMQRLGIRDVAGLVRYAIRTGLVAADA